MNTLEKIAAQLRDLPNNRTDQQQDDAGRLVAKAMDAGAFEWSVALQTLRDKTANNINIASEGHCYAAFWILLTQEWLSGGSLDFDVDCQAVADLIEKEPNRGMLRVSDAAVAFGIPKGTITKWCDAGKVNSQGQGRDRLVDGNDLARVKIALDQKRL